MESGWLDKENSCNTAGSRFFLSIFVIAAQKYDLYSTLFSKETIPINYNILADNGEWEYMDGGQEPGKGNVWTTDQYDSSFWKKGEGVFKTNGSREDIRTDSEVILDHLNQDNQNASTYFFRKTFKIDNIKDINTIYGNIYYKDTAIIYLNGSIVFAGNVPAGGYASNQEARAAEVNDGVWQNTFIITDLSSLKKGENILSVEIHQGQTLSDDAYFYLEYFNMEIEEAEEEDIDIKTLILVPGTDEKEIGINWTTYSDDFYKIEYMEEADYTGKISRFSRKAQVVLMSRNSIKDTDLYKNRAMLKRLKSDTEYLYRIVKVGGKDASSINNFHTSARSGYSFAVLGDPQLGAYNNNDTEIWTSSVTAALNTLGKNDFIISVGDQVDGSNDLQTVLNCYSIFRSPEVFKEIPIMTVKGNHEAAGITEYLYNAQFVDANPSGNYWFTYQDSLIIALDSNSKAYEEQREFIYKAIEDAQKKWVIVVMHHSIFSGGEHNSDETIVERRKEYSDIFHDADIDLVLSGHDHIYSRSYYMSGMLPDKSPEGQQKDRGETLYITSGSSSGNKFYGEQEKKLGYTAFEYTESDACVTHVKVGKNEITIIAYTIADGKEIDRYTLVKE
ncbi:MAG: metallophosphoesterase family protein [Lachnospiraceae bacterium]|nr:metallophosphoesterase family protein [Lachnospiraceae bacterium]